MSTRAIVGHKRTDGTIAGAWNGNNGYDIKNDLKLPQELLAEDLWLLWVNTYGVLPLNEIDWLLQKNNLKLKKGKSIVDVRLAVGRGFEYTSGNMEFARKQIADEIDKICIIARWDFAVAKYCQK